MRREPVLLKNENNRKKTGRIIRNKQKRNYLCTEYHEKSYAQLRVWRDLTACNHSKKC